MVQNLQSCKKCGEAASGPDVKSVAAAMKRHECKSKKKVKR